MGGGKMTKHTLRPIAVLLLAVLVVLPLAWVSESYGQANSPASAPAAGTMKQIEGAIKSVDPAGRMLTLMDGTELTLPPTASLPPDALKEGDIVRASYEEQDGQKVLTSLEVQKK